MCIYVLCVPYLKTGGTELLHQLVYQLNMFNIDCKIVYTLSEDSRYLNPAFQKYVQEYLLETDIVDDKENILILPETYTYYLKRYSKIQMYIWWLSVDNYIKKNVNDPKKLMMYLRNEYGEFRAILEVISRYIKKKHRSTRAVPIKEMKNVKLHLTQSYYAYDFLKKEGVKELVYLSDYINDVYIENGKLLDIGKKEDIVVYNPKKGKYFTKKIMKSCKDVCFVPLVNMDNEQIMEILTKAKIYIDFGSHPGKDRFPREAAIMKCCVITGYRGSANYKDVLIDDRFKFEDKKSSINAISMCIRKTLMEYESCIELFEDYRKLIELEKQLFKMNCEEIFQQ